MISACTARSFSTGSPVAKVEAELMPLARKAGHLLGGGIEPLVLLRDLEHRFATALRVTYRFAEQSAIRELRELRARQPSPAVTAIRDPPSSPAAPSQPRRVLQ